MNNPYVSRGPVRNPAMFFDRQHELQEIAAFLAGNQSISVVGPRKIGKTSLLFQLMRPETWAELNLGENNLYIYLDCEVLGESTHEEIFAQFAVEIGEALLARDLPLEPALEEVVNKPTRLAFERAIRRLNQRSLRVVLVLDEFERLSTNPNLDVNFFNALRSAAGRYQLAYITASARPLIQLTYSSSDKEILSSPFFNIFAPLFLGMLPEAEARRLIRVPAQAAGVTFAPELEDFLFKLCGGNPFALQVACFYAFDLPNDPAEIEHRTMQELGAHFEYYWRNLSPQEQSTLRQLTELAGRAAGDTTLRGILRDLVQKCLLTNEGGAYRYPSTAWASFVNSQGASATAAITGGRLMTGTHFGPYEVLDLLGRGGMAEVYLGRHTRLERAVAIKVLPAHMAAETDFRTRFEREARSIAALRHPNIVQVYDFGDIEGTYYMVMEFINGKDLGVMMKETGPLLLDLVRSLVADLGSALDYAHAQGLIHRDVKPSNVLIQPAPAGPAPIRAILTDFGIAKIISGDTDATKTGLMMGTLNYMAPEQIRSSGEVDRRADVYAVGIMLYQMLTGRLPFQADNPGAMMLAHLQTQPSDPRELAPDLPAAAAEAILCALAKDPEERFPTVGALASALLS